MAELSVRCENCSEDFKVIAEGARAITNITCPHCGHEILQEGAADGMEGRDPRDLSYVRDEP